MFRVPIEPDATIASECDGLILPSICNFKELKLELEGKETKKVYEYMNDFIHTSLNLCDPSFLHNQCEDSESHYLPIKVHNKRHTLVVRVETLPLTGFASSSEMKAVRHVVKLPVRPDVAFDALNRFCYTKATDPYLDLVEVLEFIDPRNEEDQCQDENEEGTISWSHVTYTVDQFVPIIMATRDFVSLDFASERHMIYCSRSCIHPRKPPKALPGIFPSPKTSAYRVPFMYCQRIVADESDPNGCILVQFQFTDVGGIVPPNEMAASIKRFGINHIRELMQLVDKDGHYLGKGRKGFMQDPLRQHNHGKMKQHSVWTNK